MRATGITLGLFGLGSLGYFVASEFWRQFSLDPWINLTYGLVLTAVLATVALTKRINLECVGMVLFGYALDLLILSPAFLYPAIPGIHGGHATARPYATVVLTLAALLTIPLASWVVLCVARYRGAALFSLTVGVSQLWIGFVCLVWAGMTVTGNYL